jgi:zinc protease
MQTASSNKIILIMKRLILTLIVLSAGFNSLLAQSTTTSFTVDGIKVIYKPSVKKVINVRVYFRGGVTNYPVIKAGIENLALEAASQCGTKKYSADAIKDTCDKYGINLFGESGYDSGFIQLNCIAKYFNIGWDLFTDAVNNPLFDPSQTVLLKNRIQSYIKGYHSNANNNLYDLLMESAFANTPYAINPIGTEETIAGITADDLKSHYNKILNKNQMFIVVVGNITKDELYEKILAAFNNIKSVPYTTPILTTQPLTDNKLLNESQDLKTNYVGAVMNAPEFTSPDFVPFRLALTGLSGNLYSYIRSTQGLSYDPVANTLQLRMPVSVMTASTTNPQQVMLAMLTVLKQVQIRGYDDEWLQHIKNSYITNNYINEQSTAEITNSLGRAEILGNWQYDDDLPQLVNMVTVEQLNNVINYYIKGLRWVYLGNTDAIAGFKPPVY